MKDQVTALVETLRLIRLELVCWIHLTVLHLACRNCSAID